MPISRCDQLEASLDAALRRFVHERSTARRKRQTGLDLRFLFARLGFAFADLDELALAGGGSDLRPSLRGRLVLRLETERRRLVRLARGRSAVYDAGRHLAVRTAILWLEDAPPDIDPLDADGRLSGAALNARFRRRASPRASA